MRTSGAYRAAAEPQAGDTAVDRALHDGRVSGQQAERTAVVRQHVGVELTDAALLTGLEDLVEQARAEPESLPAVRDDETDVDGPVARGPVPGHPAQLRLLPLVGLGDHRP